MKAQVNAPIEVFNNILKSLSDTIRGDSDTPMDINLVAKDDNSLQVYVRHFNVIQVMHELDDQGSLDIDVEESGNMIFSSQTLYSLIRKVDSEHVTLKFDRDTFRIRVGDDWFSTPTEFKLRVFQESEWSPPIEPENFKEVRKMKVDPLRQKLNMMSSIAPEVNFKIQSGEFWISVEDAVQGQGRVMKDLSDECEIDGLDYSYEIDPIETFLKNVRTDRVDVKMTNSGGVMLNSDSSTHTSYLLLAHRIEDN